MRELRRAAHTVYSLHYHFVFTTKYRKPVLVGEIGHSVRDLIPEICRSEDIEILERHVRPDYVHLLLSTHPISRRAVSCRRLRGRPRIISSKIIEGCGRRSGVGTCGGAATSCAAAGTSPTRRLPSIFGSKVPSPGTTTVFKLANEPACMRGSARPFSRLQSTHKPSPSGEGISLALAPTRRPPKKPRRS